MSGLKNIMSGRQSVVMSSLFGAIFFSFFFFFRLALSLWRLSLKTSLDIHGFLAQLKKMDKYLRTKDMQYFLIALHLGSIGIQINWHLLRFGYKGIFKPTVIKKGKKGVQVMFVRHALSISYYYGKYI